MKIVQRVLMVFFIVVIVILFTYPLIIAETWNIDSGKGSSLGVFVNNVVDSVKNGKNYDKYVKKFVEEQFGEVVSVKLDITIGTRVNNNTYAYMVRFNDVLSKNFNIYVKSNGGCYSDISDILSKDPKFQHLYSEWVKKQIGIEDENVEFQFAGNFDNPYIEFDKITSLSEDYREIFENTHNLYAWLCEVSSIRNLTDDNVLEIAKNIRENYLLKAIQITKIPTDKKFGGRIRISSGENTNEKSIVYNVDFDINSLSDNFSDMEYRKYD